MTNNIKNLNYSKLKNTILYYSGAIFISSLVGYLLLFLIETIEEGFVSNYFDINILLWLCFFSGIILVFVKSDKKTEVSETTYKDYIFIIFIGICAGAIVWYYTLNLEYIPYLLGPATSLVIIYLSSCIIKGK
jgi:hypothetical protein